MTEHVLKTLPDYWRAIERGDKNFEVRRDDRGFQRGDVLVLRRVTSDHRREPEVKRQARSWSEETTYHDLRRRVTYVLTGGQFGVKPGHVVLALAPEEEP